MIADLGPYTRDTCIFSKNSLAVGLNPKFAARVKLAHRSFGEGPLKNNKTKDASRVGS